jgi:hypothetical protein
MDGEDGHILLITKIFYSRTTFALHWLYWEFKYTTSSVVSPRPLFQLAISPQAKSNMDPIPIHYDTQLTLSVEGIIQHGGKAGLFRKVKAVQVAVKSSLTTRSQSLLAADTTGKVGGVGEVSGVRSLSTP